MLLPSEAAALNALRAELIKKNFAKVVKRLTETVNSTDEFERQEFALRLHDEFSAYAPTFTFPAPRSPRPVINPAFREAQKIARAQITAALQQRGIKPSSLKPGFMESRVEALLEKSPEILAEAERRLAALKTVSEDILGEVT